MLKKYLLLLSISALFLMSACVESNVASGNRSVKQEESSIKTDDIDAASVKESEENNTDSNVTDSKDKAGKSESVDELHTPEKGSEEREAIMDALRVPVEKELKQEIVFAPNHLKVLGDWAFISGEPLSKAGKRPDYKGTVYAEEVENGVFDNNFFALLKRTGDTWKVSTYALGCTDVCYLDWNEKYNAPKEIFP